MKKLVLALAMIGAVGAANAATLVNHAAPINVAVGSATVNTSSPFNWVFDYVGGTVTFKFQNFIPTFGTAKYTLTGGSESVSQVFNLDNVVGAFPDVFKISLAGGNYNLKIETQSNLSNTEVSAVPLPAAALLFGSSLLGAGALRRKQKAGKEVVAV